MKLLIAAVGHKMPDWVAKGCAEYIKRMPRVNKSNAAAGASATAPARATAAAQTV